MVHRVVAVFQIDLAPEDAEGFGHGEHLVRLAGNAGDAVGDVAHIIIHDFGRVALRIDGHEIGIDVLALVAKLLQPPAEFEERRGADFRAVGKAEEHCAGTAAKRLFRDGLALVVHQREGVTVSLSCKTHIVPLICDDTHDRSHEDQDPGDDQSHHDGESPLVGEGDIRSTRRDRSRWSS